MATEGDEGTVLWVAGWAGGVVLHAVVVAGGVVCAAELVEFVGRHHLSDVPELHGLVFSVGEDVSTVAFAVDVCDAFEMACKDTNLPAGRHAPPVPDFDCGVV